MTTRNRHSKSLKSALHHWWPESLSQFWSDDEGCVTQLWWDGREVRSQPGSFGAITNAHHIKYGEDSPWNSTFEHVFQRADDTFPALADWLMKLELTRAAKRASFHDRFSEQPLSRERRRQLAECLASLVVRSPVSRNNIRITVEEHRKGLPDPRADKTLIAANMDRSQSAFRDAIDRGGKFIVLITDSQEFIFGDGFLHNFPVVPDYVFSCRCIVPILPVATVLFVKPTLYRTQPELMTFLLRREEVTFFNEVAQIYSRDFVFYRKDKPSLIPAFSCNEFRQFRCHDHPALTTLIQSAVDFMPK